MAQPGSLNALAVARRVAAALVEDGLAYAIGGALALGAWGAPRATQDVDLTVFVAGDAADRVFDALERGGLMLDRVACRRDVDRIGMFKARAGRLFVDVFLAGHPQYAAMEARCVEIDDGAGGTLASSRPRTSVSTSSCLAAPRTSSISNGSWRCGRRSISRTSAAGWCRWCPPAIRGSTSSTT